MVKLASTVLLFLIRVYQKVLSPMLPARCRYYPTCSEYGRLALLWHGPYRGLALTTNRVLRCHPFGGQGLDFVPLPLYQYTFVAIATPPLCPSHLQVGHNPISPNLAIHINAAVNTGTSSTDTSNTDTLSSDKHSIERQASGSEYAMDNRAYLSLPERGVFKDCSSYSVCLNYRLNHSNNHLVS